MNSPVKLIETKRLSDARGWFCETYAADRWALLGVDARFVQDNHSFSLDIGTIRGIHFQKPPHAQAKLVRCTQGSILDIAVDLRRGSPSYGQHVAAELSASNGRQQYVPVGFGHAFITLAPDTEVSYKVSDYYAPECEGGIRWDCPELAITWPLPPGGPGLSAKDAALPSLSTFTSPFVFDGNPLPISRS